ncbi:unnamed protein product [Peniophora sp. CBMAI 1063]|nr:unnamed protein product [Peniophora sp. CBMAI 1063]
MARLTHWKQPASSPEEPDTTLDMTFQIPEAGHATQLLNMGDDDFLDGTDDTFGSPQRSPQQHALAQPPLTLEELTPRKKLKSNLRDVLSTKIYAESTPFLKRDKFSPVRRTRAGQDEENVQPHDMIHEAAEAAPAGSSSRSTSPKRIPCAPARPQSQRLTSDDDLASSSPQGNETMVKSIPPSVPAPATGSTETLDEALRPMITAASKTVHSETKSETLSMPSVPRAHPKPSRSRQHTRNPSTLSNEAVKTLKAAATHTARPKKTTTIPATDTQRAPVQGRPKTARPVGSTDDTAKPAETEMQCSEPDMSPDSAASVHPHGSATVITNVSESYDGLSYSRPSTPQGRRASSPLTVSKLSPSKRTPDAVLAPLSSAPMQSAERAPSSSIATTLHPVKPVPSAQTKSGQLSRQPLAWALSDAPRNDLPSAAPAPTAGSSRAKAKPVMKVLAGKPQVKKQPARRRSSVQRNYCVPSVATKQKSVPRPGALTAKRRAGLQDQEQAGAAARRRDAGFASSGEGKKPMQRLTKPVEFHFKVESRLSARKASDTQDAPGTVALRDPSIPDFAARHAIEAERTQARKGRIAPTIPQSPGFTVNARLREREKFEEGRRAREAEIEQQRELERQREREAEEAELRRLRKLAVPKANAVPEWYAHAPKKSSRSASSSTSGAA